MAEQDPNVGSDDEQETSNYKRPAEKALNEILTQDTEDESLARYKASLLGSDATKGSPVVVYPDNPNTVIVKSMTLMPEGRDEIVLELYGANLDDLKKHPFKIKEGSPYRIKIKFWVQREIVSGLKYVQKTKKMGVNVDKMDLMVGSYGPQLKEHEYSTPVEEAPSGMLARGSYGVKSKFTDDDGKDYLSWEWKFEISKSWD